MTTLHSDLESAAREAAGNWRHFESFGWHDRPEDPDQWTIVYTCNRDSGPLDRANAEALADTMEPFMDGDDPDCFPEHHGHWACGWVDGYSIRVYRNGQITDAFRAWMEAHDRLNDHPILDEERYSEIQYEESQETFDNCYRRDLERHLEKRFEAEFNWPDSGAMWDLFSEVADNACEYWYEDGSGMCIHWERVAESIDWEDIAQYAIAYVIHWNDLGDNTETFYSDESAQARCFELREQGYFAYIEE